MPLPFARKDVETTVEPMGYVVTNEVQWMKDVMDTLMAIAVSNQLIQRHLAAIEKATTE